MTEEQILAEVRSIENETLHFITEHFTTFAMLVDEGEIEIDHENNQDEMEVFRAYLMGEFMHD